MDKNQQSGWKEGKHEVSPAASGENRTPDKTIGESQDVQGKLIAVGYDPIAGSQIEVDAFFQDEVASWGKMVKALNLSIK